MFFSLRILKNLNLKKNKYIYLYKRNQNISKKLFFKKRIYISRGLYPVKYYGGQFLNFKHYKYGDFSFTRKPFAIPEKKQHKKR